ncbi:MAG: sugar phosphate isomerase/epimerase [Chloroflexi bacterium]|nr:sugar phosphate isomerase/epimerase [Chloroflexota bacterium]
MKIGVFTVMLPDLTPEAAAAALQAAGYDGIEWRVTRTAAERLREAPSFWGNNYCTLAPTAEDAQRARTLAAAHSLALPSLGTYIPVGDLQATENAMRFAQIAGAPQIRVSAGAIQDTTYTQSFKLARTYLAKVAELAERYHIKALIETHHRSIVPSASLAYRLVSDFDPQQIGVLYDPGNMVYEGFEAYRLGLDLLGPYLSHVHIKNGAFNRPVAGGVWAPQAAPLEDGVVDFPDFFAALRGVGYDGWLVVEDFSATRPSLDTLHHNIGFIKQALA